VERTIPYHAPELARTRIRTRTNHGPGPVTEPVLTRLFVSDKIFFDYFIHNLTPPPPHPVLLAAYISQARSALPRVGVMVCSEGTGDCNNKLNDPAYITGSRFEDLRGRDEHRLRREGRKIGELLLYFTYVGCIGNVLL
jgi:hypothetical protein